MATDNRSDESHGRQVGRERVGEVGHGESAATPEESPAHQEQGDGQQDNAEPEQAALADPLPGVADVGRRGTDHMRLAECA